MINFKIVGYVLGLLLIIEGFFLFTAVPVALVYRESIVFWLLVLAGFTMFSGAAIWAIFRKAKMNIGKREVYIIVSVGWILFAVFGALPYYITHTIPSFTDAFFESMSGFTTTGSSIITDLSTIPHSLLYWRSLTQWIGGLGVILLSLIIFQVLEVGGMRIYISEGAGSSPDMLHPRIKETALRLWGIYLLLTAFEILLLWIGNMHFFDALCHSFSTLSTGGFSTSSGNITAFDSPYLQYVFIFFMFLGGTNFTLLYFVVNRKFKQAFRNEEFKYYLFFILLFTVLFLLIKMLTMKQPFEHSFRLALFRAVSTISTTGYYITSFNHWIPVGTLLVLLLMFFGAMTGSTGGGIKITRIILLLKNSQLELKRLIHPSAVIPVRINKQAVELDLLNNVLSFVALYLLTVMLGVIIVSFMGYDLETSIGALLANLANIGPGIGDVGPFHTYAHFSVFGKWFLSFIMLAGRLELVTIFALFTRHFWKR